jgi:predicted transposase YbfD/YdcC
MALFGRLHKHDLQEFLELKHGVPSHDTFSKVFRWIDPKAFEEAFRKFMAAFAEALCVEKNIAIDGKALRRAFDKGKQCSPQVMVTAWGSEMRMVLACQAAQDGNERKAALELLTLVDIKGVVVTADALHCHNEMASIIKKRHGDYVLALKGNQPKLLHDAETLFAETTITDYAETKEHIHGRYEKRRAKVISAPQLAKVHNFKGVAAVGQITRSRKVDGKKEKSVQYYVMSEVMTPERFLSIVRSHWGIENKQHWVLDVIMNEDSARNRKDHGAKNLAVLRRLALNILRAEPSKMPISHKMRYADWDKSFFFNLLGHMR